jgi:hypothetical protein
MADDKATAPDADGVKTPVDDVQVDTTSAIDASAKGADPVDPDPASTVADAAAGDAAPSGEEAKGKPQRLPEWAEKKLAESEFEKRELRRKAKELEEKLAAQAAPSQPAQPNAADEAAAKANAPVGQTPEEFERAVQAEADRRVAAANADKAQREFDEKCNAAYSAGKGAYSDDFDTAVQNLRTVGAMTPEMLSLVLETDDPAKVIYELGSNPDQAASLVAMTPTKRAFEIARLSQPAPRKATPLSKAPPPVPGIDGSARVTATPSDADDDDTFFRKREAELSANGRW